MLKDMHETIKNTVTTLVENSLEAGATKVTSKIEREGKKFTVFVKDNGKGMDKETKTKVKSLLEKGDSKKPELSSLEKLAREADDFHMASKEGAGTEITFILKQ